MADWLTAATSCRITTAGRLTGEPHVVTVWFATIVTGGTDDQGGGAEQPGGAVTVYAMSRRGPAGDWVRNVLAEPAVEIASGRRGRPGRARLVDDPTEHEVARQAMYAKYAPRHRGLEAWLTDRAATLVAIDLAGSKGLEIGPPGVEPHSL